MTREEFIKWSMKNGFDSRTANSVSAYKRYLKFHQTGKLTDAPGPKAKRKVALKEKQTDDEFSAFPDFSPYF